MENGQAIYPQEFSQELFPEPRSFSMDGTWGAGSRDRWEEFSRQRWSSREGGCGTRKVRRRKEQLFAPQRPNRRLVRIGFAVITLLLGVLTLWLLGTAVGSALAESEPGAVAASSVPAGADEDDPSSTPKGEWRKGSVPHLFQRDGQWQSVAYGDGTIGTHGCGPTCLAMAYIGLTGKTDKDPGAMALFSEQNGYIDAGVTSWSLMSQGARSLGLQSQELGASAEAVLGELTAGHPVICSVGPGDFTTEGHFIVLTAADTAGNVTVNDPNSMERSRRTWDIQRVLDQCRNLWSLSV